MEADPSKLSERALRNRELCPEIEGVWKESFGVHGAGKVWGRSVAFLEGELRDAAGELVATASATGRLIRVEAGGFEL